MSQTTMIAMLEEAEDVLRRAGCDMTANKVRGVLQAQRVEPVNQQLLDAGKSLVSALNDAMPHMSTGHDGVGPDCTKQFQALIDGSQAITAAEPAARVKIGNHAPLELGSYMRVEGTPSGALKVICTREHAPAVAVPVALSEPERKFLEFVYRNPGCKCGCAWGNEGPLWPRLEELGLIRATGSYKWECTPAVSLSIAAQPPAVAVAVPEVWRDAMERAAEDLEDNNCLESAHQLRAMLAATPQAADPIKRLIAMHNELLGEYPYCYFELAYTRRTDWMAWLCTKPREDDPERKVLACGQGLTAEEACAEAISAAQKGGEA